MIVRRRTWTYRLSGQDFARTISFDMPLTAQAAAISGVFAFSVSMGEFGATSFIARPYTPTMPVARARRKAAA